MRCVGVAIDGAALYRALTRMFVSMRQRSSATVASKSIAVTNATEIERRPVPLLEERIDDPRSLLALLSASGVRLDERVDRLADQFGLRDSAFLCERLERLILSQFDVELLAHHAPNPIGHGFSPSCRSLTGEVWRAVRPVMCFAVVAQTYI